MTDILEEVVSVVCCQIYLITTEFPISIHIFHPKYGRYGPLTGNRSSLFDQDNFSKYHLPHKGSYHIGRLNDSQTTYAMMCTLTGRHTGLLMWQKRGKKYLGSFRCHKAIGNYYEQTNQAHWVFLTNHLTTVLESAFVSF